MIVDWLFKLDTALLHWINTGWSSPWLDVALPYITNLHQVQAVQLIVLPAGLAFWLFRQKKRAVRVLLALVVTGALADTLAYRVIKQQVERLRPNNDPRIEVNMRLGYGPKSHSFPSNHATNSFALATTLAWYYPGTRWVFYGVATAVGLSRIYGGVHFPSDVLGGAMIGVILSYLLRALVFRRFKLFSPSQGDFLL